MRLRYWFKESLTVIVASVGGSALYTFLMWLSDMDFGDDSPLFMGLIYLCCFGGFMGLIMNIAAHSQHLPTALSFGSTRKEAMVGMQIFRLLPGLVIAVLSAVLFIIHEGQFQPKYLLIGVLSLAVSLILGTWGSFMGIASHRYGKKALVIAIIVGILILAGSVAAIVIAVTSADPDTIFDAIFSHPVFPWAMGLIPVALYGISLIFEKKAIYTCSVKL